MYDGTSPIAAESCLSASHHLFPSRSAISSTLAHFREDARAKNSEQRDPQPYNEHQTDDHDPYQGDDAINRRPGKACDAQQSGSATRDDPAARSHEMMMVRQQPVDHWTIFSKQPCTVKRKGSFTICRRQ